MVVGRTVNMDGTGWDYGHTLCSVRDSKLYVDGLDRHVVANIDACDNIHLAMNARGSAGTTIKEYRICRRGVSSCLGYQSTTLSNGSIERYDGFE